ncbi:MAG: hypothetical protein ABIQ09_16905 [Jatrophihabitantaceae bacterium]
MSEALGQPADPSTGPAGEELAGAREGLLGAGVSEEDAAVGRVELATADALELTELAGALLVGVAEAVGWSEAVEAGEQPAVRASVANPSRASRRLPRS